MQFLLIRHGQTDYNLNHRVQGQIDIPLNELGRWQAERIGERLKTYDLCGIFSSDLSRAHDTAKAIAKHHPQLTLLTTELLREIDYGIFEGMQLGDIEQTYPEEYLQWREGDIGYAPRDAENIYDQRARAQRAINWVRERCTDSNGTVAVISHGGIQRSLIANLLDFGINEQLRLHYDNTSLTAVNETPRGMGLFLSNDTSHLGEKSPFR